MGAWEEPAIRRSAVNVTVDYLEHPMEIFSASSKTSDIPET
jgi:hypothetical protein